MGYHIVNVFWSEFQYLLNSSKDMAQNIIYSPWKVFKSPWLCLTAKLVLLCNLTIFPLLLFFFSLISLIKFILWLNFFTNKRQADNLIGGGVLSQEGHVGSCCITRWPWVWWWLFRYTTNGTSNKDLVSWTSLKLKTLFWEILLKNENASHRLGESIFNRYIWKGILSWRKQIT